MATRKRAKRLSPYKKITGRDESRDVKEMRKAAIQQLDGDQALTPQMRNFVLLQLVTLDSLIDELSRVGPRPKWETWIDAAVTRALVERGDVTAKNAARSAIPNATEKDAQRILKAYQRLKNGDAPSGIPLREADVQAAAERLNKNPKKGNK